MTNFKEFKKRKEQAVDIARQLGYPPEVRRKLRNAKDDIEIGNILKSARKHMRD